MAPTRGLLALASALVVLCLTVFVLIGEDVLDGGGLVSHDRAVLSWFVSVRTDALVSGAKIVSALGSFIGLAILSMLLALLIRVRGWRWILALVPLVALVVAYLASTSAKALFGRERPPVVVHSTTVALASFPSGHATDAAACLLAGMVVVTLTVATRRTTRAVCLLAGIAGAVLVGLSRLILGVHWLSDVVAGWALGTAIAIIVVMVSWSWISRRGTGEQR